MKLLAAAVALLAPVLSAQQNIVYHDDPNPALGNPNSFPFGAQDVRIQQLVPQSVLGGNPALIQDLFVNPRVSATVAESQVHYGDFEVRMGLTQLTTLTNTWATNSPNPTTVYRGPLLIKFVRDQWVPMGLPASYLWFPTGPGDNLVIDFICRQVIHTGQAPISGAGYFLETRSSPSLTISRAFRVNWGTGQQATSFGVDGAGIKLGFLLNDGNFVAHDGSCPGSSAMVPKIGTNTGAWPQIGAPFPVTLTNGPANGIAALVLGVGTTSYAGVPLPLEMSILGAPGCRFWHSWDVLSALVLTNGAGAATYPLPIPNGPYLTYRLYTSWLCLDPPANAFGFVPSGFATLIL